MSISNRKVVIVGAGHVGSHVGYALISQSLADEIVYIDSDRAKAVAQALDLTDATNYLPVRTRVTAGDYSDAADAQIMIIAAGPLPSGSQTRMDTLGQTIEILKEVTASIKKSGFDGIIVNISNPADVITHYIQHTLNWAPERIFSTSTTLDSARLRRAIAQETGIDQKSITAYALGEHGESQMVAWSAVTIAGKPLSQWREEYPDTFGKLDLDALADAGREGGCDHPARQGLHRVRHRRVCGGGRPRHLLQREPRPFGLCPAERSVRSARCLCERPGDRGSRRHRAHHRAASHPGGAGEVRRLLPDHERQLSAFAHPLTSVN